MQITRDELRDLFLFESLDDDQLDWLAAHGLIVEYESGTTVYSEGEPATCFIVLLDGEITLYNKVRDEQVETVRSSGKGVYAGATQSYIGERMEQIYRNTMIATRRSSVLEIPAREFGEVFKRWFPMPTHLLEGLFFGLNKSRQLIDQRERLTALGTITAGLTHELNNPAAAAARSAEELGQRISHTGQRLAELAADGIGGDELGALVAVRDRLIERKVPVRKPLELADVEDDLADWLDGHGLDNGYDLASDLVANGFEVADGEELAQALGDQRLPAAVRWLSNGLEIAQLQREIAEAVHRISSLLDSARQYSQMDRASYQNADLRDLLEATLTMLTKKFHKGDVTVVREYDPDLPAFPVFAPELNQVWTNLIVNALDAMDFKGTLTVRTAREGDTALVEFTDTGKGIPEENLSQIFTPFFTTKAVGKGTGLGLDISWRIIVKRHHGDLRVESQPGRTTFQVRLPLAGPRGAV